MIQFQHNSAGPTLQLKIDPNIIVILIEIIHK